MKTVLDRKIKYSSGFLKIKNRLWDLPKIAVKTGKQNLSKQVDQIVYGG